MKFPKGCFFTLSKKIERVQSLLRLNWNELEWFLFLFCVNFQMEPHSTFWGCWPSAPSYWAILEKVHERKNLPRQRRKSISSCVWSRGHNNLIKILRTINDMRVCIVCFWLRALTIEVQEMTLLSKITNLKHISCHVWQETYFLSCLTRNYTFVSSLKRLYQIISWLTRMDTIISNLIMINPIWHGRGYFYPLVLFWLRFCQLIFFQKFPNFFGGENLHQLGYFDTQPSSLSLIKVVPWRL